MGLRISQVGRHKDLNPPDLLDASQAFVPLNYQPPTSITEWDGIKGFSVTFLADFSGFVP